ncbi:hypothetical protein CPC08DRAFT_714638 [Agrocybe pediades]|nr:hypothetical protein CPC08DRAFT_714638 [Agrocybe pediades]
MSVTSSERLGVDAYLAIQASRYAHHIPDMGKTIPTFLISSTTESNILISKAGPLSIGRLLFILSRYYALFATICTLFYRWQGWTSIAITMMAQGILQLRVYALYSKSRRVLYGAYIVRKINPWK